MRPGRAGLLGVCGALAIAAGAVPSSAAGGPLRTAELQKRIDEAIEKGVAWLRGIQRPDGAFAQGAGEGDVEAMVSAPLGTASLAVHVLRSCGAAHDDPAVRLGLHRMRKVWKSGVRGGRSTYEVSLALLALEAHYNPPSGPRDIPEEDRAWIRDLAAWLVKAQTPDGGFGYSSPASGRSDLSNGQYALLGLKAARRCRVEVSKQVFHRALGHFISLQETTGPEVVRKEDAKGDGRDGRYGKTPSRTAVRDHARGWGYTGPNSPTGSMTAAGVSSLVICRGELEGMEGWSDKADALVVRGIRDGIAWLGHNFSVTGNPHERGRSSSSWHYYYLYGLERAGVLAGVTWMAAHDWYGEGAHYLVGAQREGGAWTAGQGMFGRRGNRPGSEGDLLDTCFALLFLKKATFRIEGAVATEERDGLLDLSGAAALDDLSFDAMFDAVFARWRRAPADRRGTLVADFVRLGGRALPRLIRRLEDPEEAARADALAALERVTGLTHGYRPGDPDEVRGRAVAAWEEWWFANRSRLVADAGAGRFRL